MQGDGQAVQHDDTAVVQRDAKGSQHCFDVAAFRDIDCGCIARCAGGQVLEIGGNQLDVHLHGVILAQEIEPRRVQRMQSFSKLFPTPLVRLVVTKMYGNIPSNKLQYLPLQHYNPHSSNSPNTAPVFCAAPKIYTTPGILILGCLHETR